MSENQAKLKATVWVAGSLIATLMIPFVIAVFYDFFLVVTVFFLVIGCFSLVFYELYKEILPVIIKDKLEEEEIIARFNGDPEKMRFYRGFKKYFRGELDPKQLQHWFEHHPRKN